MRHDLKMFSVYVAYLKPAIKYENKNDAARNNYGSLPLQRRMFQMRFRDMIGLGTRNLGGDECFG